MFGIGFQELLVILVVALIVLEPERLPEVAKSLGKFYRELKSTIDDVKSSLATDLKSVKEIECDIRSDISKLEETVLEEPIEIDKDFEKEFEKEIKRMKVNECCKKEQIIDY
jgi:Tat protein translocase TatB subunit